MVHNFSAIAMGASFLTAFLEGSEIEILEFSEKTWNDIKSGSGKKFNRLQDFQKSQAHIQLLASYIEKLKGTPQNIDLDNWKPDPGLIDRFIDIQINIHEFEQTCQVINNLRQN